MSFRDTIKSKIKKEVFKRSRNFLKKPLYFDQIFEDNLPNILRKIVGSKPLREDIKKQIADKEFNEFLTLSEVQVTRMYSKTILNERDIEKKVSEKYEQEPLKVRGHEFLFPKGTSVHTLINEIYVAEEYFFETDKEDPVIFDCGSHVGSAVGFFKTIFPKSKITCFEASPAIYEFLKKNVERNQFADVTCHNIALAKQEGSISFYESVGDTMGGSLTQRKAMNSELHQIEVSAKTLSSFMDQEIDFLKLDIEGVELEILEEIEPKLHLVKNLFCEFHFGENLKQDRLIKILEILDRNGFHFHISRSFSSNVYASFRPMQKVGQPLSHCVWAKRVKKK